MRNSPPITVGLPVYNGERYLKEALDSVLNQSCTDFGLIISDNGSTDLTPDICQEYASADSRISYYRSAQNRGSAWNFNRVFGLADSPYFKWVNHDDLWEPQMLERSIQVLDAAPPEVALCYPRTTFIDEQGQMIRNYDDGLNLRQPDPAQRLGALVRNLRRCNAIFGLMRSDRLASTRLLGPYIDADRVLLAELSMVGQFWEIGDRLFRRRMHPEGSTFANTTRAQSARWWNPGARQRVYLPNWRLLGEHVRAIQHVPLPSGARRRCYLTLASSWPPTYRRVMIGDLKAATYRFLPSSATRR